MENPIIGIEKYQNLDNIDAPYANRDANAFKKIKLGSLSGGGRYDKLVSRFLNDDYPSVGISIGLDRILMLLKL